MDKPTACPICASEEICVGNVGVVNRAKEIEYEWRVWCVVCAAYAVGKDRNTAEAAIESWNKRRITKGMYFHRHGEEVC